MMQRVRVRRERPSVLSWALALALTMLAVYLITLSAGRDWDGDDAEPAAARVTRETILPGATAHLAALGPYADASTARIAAAELTRRGAAGMVFQKDGQTYVAGATYDQPTDAQRIAARLQEQGLPGIALTLSAQDVRLKITAREDDAESLERAATTLREVLSRLGELALKLDRGTLGSRETRTLAAVSRSELSAAAQALRKVNGAEDQRVCGELLRLCEQILSELDPIAQSRDLTGAALSGQLRCVQIHGVIEWIDALQTLSAS